MVIEFIVTSPPFCSSLTSTPSFLSRLVVDSKDGVSYQEDDPLSTSHLNHLHETSIVVRGDDVSNVVVTVLVTVISTQNRLKYQILHHFQQFKDLKETYAVSQRTDQLCLCVM